MAEIEKFEGDLFWSSNDPELSVNDPDDEMDGVGIGEIVEFEQARRLPNLFGVYCGEGKCRYFETLVEAKKCLAASSEKKEEPR